MDVRDRFLGIKQIAGEYKFNVLITTYEVLMADHEYLVDIDWRILCVDEGPRWLTQGPMRCPAFRRCPGGRARAVRGSHVVSLMSSVSCD